MKKLSILLIQVVFAISLSAQDVHFSQFWENPQLMNPALTGVIPADFRVNTTYRNQWASVASPYKTYALGGQYRYQTGGSADLGFGLNVYRDIAGDTKFSTTNIQLSMSGIVAIDRNNKISVGIRGGFLQKSVSPADMMWGNQYQGGTHIPTIDPGENINMEPGMKGDVSAGIVYVYHSDESYITATDQFNAKVGFSYNHINKPTYDWTTVSEDELYSNYIGYAELLIGLGNTRWSLLPSAAYLQQGPSKEIYAGTLFRYRLQDASKVTGYVKGAYLSAGMHVRFKDALVPTFLFEFDKYALGVSYDINTSALRAASGMKGGFEITLRFQTPNPYLFKGSRASFK